MAGPTSLQLRPYEVLYARYCGGTPPPSDAALARIKANKIEVAYDEAIFLKRPTLHKRQGTEAPCPAHYVLGEQAATVSVLMRQRSKMLQDFLGKGDSGVPHRELLGHTLSVRVLAERFIEVISSYNKAQFPTENTYEKQAHILLMLRICNVFEDSIGKFNVSAHSVKDPLSVPDLDRTKLQENLTALNGLHAKFSEFHLRIRQEADILTKNGEIYDLAKLYDAFDELNRSIPGRGDAVQNASKLVQQVRITLATVPEAASSILQALSSEELSFLSTEEMVLGGSGGGAASAVAPAHGPASLSHCFAISNLPADAKLALRGEGGPLSWESNYPIPYRVVGDRVTFTLPSSEIREFKFVAVKDYADADPKWEQNPGNRSLRNSIPTIQFDGPGDDSAPAEYMSFRVHNLPEGRTLALRGEGGPLSWGSNFEIRPTTRSDGSVIISIPQGITAYKFVAVQASTGDVKWESKEGNRTPDSRELEGEIRF